MMTLKKIFLAISIPFFLAACSSSPKTHFYLLQALETKAIQLNKSQLEPITVLVNPIKFPAYLDRPQIVLRDSDYKLQLSENHRWAEPLSNEFSRVFIENLNSRIAPGHALVYAELNGIQPTINLTIEVVRLDVNTADQAVLSVKWAYWAGENAEKMTRFTNEYRAPIKDKDYQSKIEAQSRAIADFADYVAETIESFAMPLN
jgi:uncharacterized lipoprotein YmbA